MVSLRAAVLSNRFLLPFSLPSAESGATHQEKVSEISSSGLRKENAADTGPLRPSAPAWVTLPENKLQLAKIRHELRTPINHIIGYSEILEEDIIELGQLVFLEDIKRIQAAGRSLLQLVNEVFGSQEGQARTVDARETLPDLRTPINHVIGYAEILEEQAMEAGFVRLVPDLQKIRQAGKTLLALIELQLLAPTKEGPAQVGGSAPKQGKEANEPASGKARAAIAPALVLPTNSPSGAEVVNWKILVVDDDADNREMLSRRVIRLGYQAEAAESGEKALEMLRTRAFDLVLLDLLMPGMDGAQVLAEMKSDEKLSNVPVIMLSALDLMDRVVECIEGGAEDYIGKPFNAVFLKARINAVLEKKRMRDLEHVYLQRIQTEQQKSERLLLNVLPGPIADRLKGGETTLADQFPEATVVFADVVGFTSLSTHISAGEVVQLLDEIFSAFDLLADRRGLEKIKTIGDAYMAACGLPARRADHVAAAADFCLDVLKEVSRFNGNYHTSINLRVGIATGPVIAGIIGRNKFIYDLWGDTVNTASRMESHGIPGRIQVTAAVFEALKGTHEFEARGEIEVKGKGAMQTYFLGGRKA